MSKLVAAISADGRVFAINMKGYDYVTEPFEVLVTGMAWVDGDYVDGCFYPPQPYPSWNRHEGEWLPPVALPTDGEHYFWDEESQNWQTPIEP